MRLGMTARQLIAPIIKGRCRLRSKAAIPGRGPVLLDFFGTDHADYVSQFFFFQRQDHISQMPWDGLGFSVGN